MERKKVSKKARRLGLATAGASVAVFGFMATSAQAAAPNPSASAELKAQIADQLQRAPGGEIVNDYQVAYDNGSVIVTMPGGVSPAALSDCPNGWYCVWSSTQYTGSRYQFRSEGYWQDLRDYGISRWQSMYNHRSHRLFVSPNPEGGGGDVCYQAGTRISNSTNHQGWVGIYLGESNARCP